jgi:hypothetical protein
MWFRLYLAVASYQAIVRGGGIVCAIAAFSGEMQAFRSLPKADVFVRKN